MADAGGTGVAGGGRCDPSHASHRTSPPLPELYDAQEAGAVFLGGQGCGYTSLLVMTGPHRGAVWEDLGPMDRGIEPTGYDFARWYRSRLERTERQLGVAPAASPPGADA